MPEVIIMFINRWDAAEQKWVQRSVRRWQGQSPQNTVNIIEAFTTWVKFNNERGYYQFVICNSGKTLTFIRRVGETYLQDSWMTEDEFAKTLK